MPKKWQLLPKHSDDLFQQLLYNRNLKTKEEQEEFLKPPQPTFDNIFPKSKIHKREFSKALSRIFQAIQNKEKIIIYGDYDTDGITGTTILWETIYYLGGDCLPYIPDRAREGYGLNKAAIKKLAGEKAKLIITVDCGITNAAEIALAKKLGLDVIITDHHYKGKNSVEAFAVIHDNTLVGASIAWLLSEGLLQKYQKEKRLSARVPSKLKLNQNWELVAMGTIADLQPLLGKNRCFVKWGLQELNHTKRRGLKSLIEQAELKWGAIGTYEVGFVIVPRLNASGRLQDALQAVRLLCLSDETQAFQLAHEISQLNIQRQEMTSTSFTEAEEQIEIDVQKKIIVLANEKWHEGIVGLIASRIKEKYYLPTLAISIKNNIGKGSARSISGFNMIETLQEVREYLIECGGHPMAAGFSIKADNINSFRDRLEEIASRKISPELLENKLEIEAELDYQQITWETEKIIDQFKPFGVGNHEPLFLLNKVIISEKKLLGKGKNHLKLRIRRDESIYRGKTQELELLGWSMGERFHEVKTEDKIKVVFSLSEDEWNGIKRLKLKMNDFKVIDEKQETVKR